MVDPACRERLPGRVVADLDGTAVVAAPLGPAERAACEAVHSRLATEVDASYVLLDDARRSDAPSRPLAGRARPRPRRARAGGDRPGAHLARDRARAAPRTRRLVRAPGDLVRAAAERYRIGHEGPELAEIARAASAFVAWVRSRLEE